VDVEAHDIQGAEVNFAGRLAHEIKGPEIWLSDPAILAVRRYGTGEHPILDWEPHRNVRFRGFETESFTLWSLVTTGSRSAVATPDEKASGLTGTEIQSKPSGIVDTKSRRQFDVAAQNYDRVDFVSSAEVVIDQCDEDKERGIYAQVDFIEHLYVESAKARIEFGVRRAIVTVDNDGPGRLVRAEPLRGDMARRNAKFVTLHEAPDAVSICVDPNPGRNSLAELSLPPTPRENYLCQLATATSDVTADELRAELQVSLDVEGLYLADDIAAKVVSSKKNRSKR
jgi:hypothetical protein